MEILNMLYICCINFTQMFLLYCLANQTILELHGVHIHFSLCPPFQILLNSVIVLNSWVPTGNVNINKLGEGIQVKGWGAVRKLFSVKSGNPLSLIMGIASAKSRSKSLPSHLFASFVFLMFTVISRKMRELAF